MESSRDPKLPRWDDLFAARINDRAQQQDSRWAYGFVELFSNPDNGALILADPGRSGTPTNSPAYALDDSGIFEIGSIVHIRARGACAGRPIFEIICSAQPVSEEGSGGSSGSGSGSSGCRVTYISGVCLRQTDGSGSGYELDTRYDTFNAATCTVVSRWCVTSEV